MTREEKIQAIIEADVQRMDMYDLAAILRGGRRGYNSMSNSVINKLYDALPQ